MDEYLGVIKIFTGNYVPQDYLPCDGRLLSINEYTALYAVLGLTYGGDGRANFALPDLRSRVVVGTGQGISPQGPLTNYPLGVKSGVESVTLSLSQMPAHTHAAQADGSGGSVSATVTVNAGNAGTTTNNPQGAYWGLAPNAGAFPVKPYTNTKSVTMASDAVQVAINGNIQLSNIVISPSGGSTAHENRQPYIALNYMICVNGIFPPRN